MPKVLFLSLVIAAACGTGYAFDDDDQGRVKFSFDSLPILGGSDKSGDGEQERVSDYHDEDEYKYDAMGRKVPARTLRSGDGEPVH